MSLTHLVLLFLSGYLLGLVIGFFAGRVHARYRLYRRRWFV